MPGHSELEQFMAEHRLKRGGAVFTSASYAFETQGWCETARNFWQNFCHIRSTCTGNRRRLHNEWHCRESEGSTTFAALPQLLAVLGPNKNKCVLFGCNSFYSHLCTEMARRLSRNVAQVEIAIQKMQIFAKQQQNRLAIFCNRPLAALPLQANLRTDSPPAQHSLRKQTRGPRGKQAAMGPQTTRDTPEPNREKPSITKLDRTRYDPLRANAAYLAAEGLVAEMRLRVLSQGGLDGERFMAGRALVRPFLGVDPDVTYQVARFLELLGDWTELQWDFEHFIPGSRSLLSIENGGPLYVTVASDHFDRSVESAHCVDVNNRAHNNVTKVRRMYGFLKNLNQKSDHRLTHFKLQHS